VNLGGILKITHGTSTFAAQLGKKKARQSGPFKACKEDQVP
jgi:hypothetical protein